MIITVTGLILAGKSTLAKLLMQHGYKLVLEYTTRPMREGEKNNVDYHFVDDGKFSIMEAGNEFAETFHVETIYGTWKYGARKDDLKDGHILICGPVQMAQLLDSGIPCLSVLLDIKKDTAIERAVSRRDDFREFTRRFEKDRPAADRIRGRVDLLLDAENKAEVNARIIVDAFIQKTAVNT